MRFPFPEDFLFGAAGSAVQHESACYEDGKGENIHDRCYKQEPEAYFGDPNEAADFYHRYPEDIQMMKQLGLKAFRFSISWARIYPNSPEQVNQAGLDYYKDMVDRLVDAGIAPFFDLWHCDLPQWVAERGGLLHEDFSDWFISYAKTVFEALGDKVAYWSTVNEPHANVMGVYMDGVYPPFSKGRENSYLASHNMILVHYRTVRMYKQMGFKGQIGAVVHVPPCYTVEPGTAEDEAATERYQARYFGWWLDPMLKGHYPQNLLEYSFIRDAMPENFAQQLAAEFIPSDFIGINYYNPANAKYEPDDQINLKVTRDQSLPTDESSFRIYPPGLFDAMMYLKNTYPGKDIYITENGYGKKRMGNMEEALEDDYRVNYIREHFRMMSRAIEAGAPLKGYFHWSLMDTHEMRGGFKYLFGLVQVDLETKERHPRKSWYYYQQIIKDGFVT